MRVLAFVLFLVPTVAAAGTNPFRTLPEEALRPLGAERWELSRSWALEVLDDLETLVRWAVDENGPLWKPPALAGWGRAVPAFRDGRLLGQKLFAINAQSPLARLGFHIGDVVLGVNEHAVPRLQDALPLFEELRESRELRVEVLRERRPVTLTFVLR